VTELRLPLFRRKAFEMIYLLEPKWARQLSTSGETGMGYHVVSVVLKDGTRYDQVLIVEGCITQIILIGTNIPFSERDIHEIIVTHDKWDFGREK
jgi:hypothetical protein